MRATLLGTATSQGIPVIACSCDTCSSADPRDQRLRCSLHIGTDTSSVLIDAGPDLRQQILHYGIDRLDAVILTHEHNDHIIGLDDLRPFIFNSNKPMTIYGETRVLNDVRQRFAYAFEYQPYPGAPAFDLVDVSPGECLSIGDINIELLRVYHGSLPILGIKVRGLAYLTDTKTIPPSTLTQLRGLNYLIIDTLHERDHHSHLNLKESTAIINQLAPSEAYLIHVSHTFGPTAVWEKKLPQGVFPSFDGLQFEL